MRWAPADQGQGLVSGLEIGIESPPPEETNSVTTGRRGAGERQIAGGRGTVGGALSLIIYKMYIYIYFYINIYYCIYIYIYIIYIMIIYIYII